MSQCVICHRFLPLRGLCDEHEGFADLWSAVQASVCTDFVYGVTRLNHRLMQTDAEIGDGRIAEGHNWFAEVMVILVTHAIWLDETNPE